MPRIEVSPWLPAALCAFWMLTPRSCFLPFLAAAVVHELGHCAAVALTGGKLLGIRLTATGAVLETAPISYGKEALCALAGPVAGLLLLPLGRFFPWLTFWGLAQSLYNLLPLYPLDGGRALRCGLLMRLPPERALTVSRTVAVLFAAILAVVGLWYTFVLRLGLWVAILACAAVCKAIAAI